MGLDIRTPIGIMFVLLGGLLTLFGVFAELPMSLQRIVSIDGLLTRYGIFAEKAIYAKSLGVNVNLWWGLVMLVFGVWMLLMGRRGTSQVHLTEDSPEGRKIEEREHRMGLEENS